jgi:hypothetical protein
VKDKTFAEIIKDQADFVKRSGFVVEVNSARSVVLIWESECSENEYSLHDWQADEWIDECRKIYESDGNLILEDVYYAQVKQIIECMD